MVVFLLETLDGCFSTFSTKEESVRTMALDVATSLMTGPVSTCIQNQAKALLGALHPSKKSYHNHKVCREFVQTFCTTGLILCFEEPGQ